MAIQKNFVIKNGLEVNTDLIVADKDSDKVGIATTNPRYTLHVNGGIGVTNSIVSGVSTVNNLTINGAVSAGSSLGNAGQYLVSTGTGVTWGAVPTVRSTDLQTAGVGATTFNTTYTVGLLDVYINGVKLSADEYTANNGATVALDDACFGGETVEFISYSPFGIGVGGTSIQGITILEEGTPVGGALQVTSINFVGASVTAVGSGIGVTVYLSNYVSNSGIATYANISGISTYSSNSGIATYADTAGISTYSSNSGIATYANISGISTNVIGGVASVSQLYVNTGITTLGVVTSSDIYSSGIVTATNGFTSGIGVTDPVQITVIGNVLIFNVVGVGSTSFTLL
jgi:hypothetical protein